MIRAMLFTAQILTFTATFTLLAACGGGAPAPAPAPAPTPPDDSGFVPGEFLPSANFKDMCAVPRSSSNFSDSQGTTLDENQWLRSISNEIYLWYNEIEDLNPADYTTPAYFDLLRTNATTPSGAPRDQFHFTFDTDEFIALAQSGITVGYGAEFALLRATPPREIVVAFTEPDSSATSSEVNLQRGARILEIDGSDAVNGGTQADVDVLNAGLFPSTAGETHDFLIEDRATGIVRSVTMTAQETVTDPVQNVNVIDTANGPVGYLTFNTHIDTAEDELFNAMSMLETAGVTELVLDIRYNGGGLLLIANQLAAMIAGPAAASGRIFDELQFNDKHTEFDPVTGAPLQPDLFMQTTFGRGDSAPNRVLPALNLNRVFVLSGPRTCSASESIINGLRGIDIEVVLIGETTCGKPYGFYPLENCGTTYFTVQFRGANAKDFGDYADGFSPANLTTTAGVSIPGCAVADDFSKLLGDPEEARLAAALNFMQDGSCPAPSGFGSSTTFAASSTASSTAAGGLAIGTGPDGKAPALRMPGSVRKFRANELDRQKRQQTLAELTGSQRTCGAAQRKHESLNLPLLQSSRVRTSSGNNHNHGIRSG